MVIIKVIVYLFKRDNSNVQVFDGPALLIPIWKKTKWGTNNTLKMKKKLSEKIIDLTFVKVGGKCSNIIMDQCKKVSQFLSQNLKLFCSLMYFV